MSQTPFVGRIPQLSILQRASNNRTRSSITAVYGRRRIGKTRLIMEASRKSPILHFEGIEGASSAEQRRHFLKTLARHSGMRAHQIATSGDWEDLLILLAEFTASQPVDKKQIIFFDEFQWMAAGRNELVGKLKFVWDNYLEQHCNVHLILCGSVSSFLVKKVIRSKAFYGRIDQVINLGPLNFSEVKSGFFPNRSVHEALEFYLDFGGVPKYLEMYEASRSVRLNLADLCFKPEAWFVTEFDRLFTSHFGKSRHYQNVVEFLADRRLATRDEIAGFIGVKSGGRISEILENLILAGFVESYGSVHNPQATSLKRYRISDPYLLFYFRFIYPLRSRIGVSDQGVPLHQALPDKRYEIFLGLAFEHFCYRHASLIAGILGFAAVVYEHGSWFKRKDQTTGAQIDLLYKRADNVITLCEIKHSKLVDKSVIKSVEAKAEALGRYGSFTIEKVLISAWKPTAEVYQAGYFSKILTAETLAVD
jgi:uncharacterized protein